MWEFGGVIEYICNKCGTEGEIAVSELSVECTGGSERGMGEELIYEISSELECSHCDSKINISFEANEYPIGFLSFVINNTTGASTPDEPRMIHLEELFHTDDFGPVQNAIEDLTLAIKYNPTRIRSITSREFEEIIAAVFEKKGFNVELTKRTRDGGKDIIAISTDGLGIKNKYFIECKHYDENNKISVSIVRELYGVMNQKDGPNKTIMVTTSSFTSDAQKFVNNDISSSWDITLADYNQVIEWIKDH